MSVDGKQRGRGLGEDDGANMAHAAESKKILWMKVKAFFLMYKEV